jgi:hypothetical protein
MASRNRQNIRVTYSSFRNQLAIKDIPKAYIIEGNQEFLDSDLYLWI